MGKGDRGGGEGGGIYHERSVRKVTEEMIAREGAATVENRLNSSFTISEAGRLTYCRTENIYTKDTSHVLHLQFPEINLLQIRYILVPILNFLTTLRKLTFHLFNL